MKRSRWTTDIENIAPGVILVFAECCTQITNDSNDITLLVQNIIISASIIDTGIGQSTGIVNDIKHMVYTIFRPGLANDLAIQGQIAVSYISDLIAVTDAGKTENIFKRVYSILRVFVNKNLAIMTDVKKLHMPRLRRWRIAPVS